jgi:hypothetical protein
MSLLSRHEFSLSRVDFHPTNNLTRPAQLDGSPRKATASKTQSRPARLLRFFVFPVCATLGHVIFMILIPEFLSLYHLLLA